MDIFYFTILAKPEMSKIRSIFTAGFFWRKPIRVNVAFLYFWYLLTYHVHHLLVLLHECQLQKESILQQTFEDQADQNLPLPQAYNV